MSTGVVAIGAATEFKTGSSAPLGASVHAAGVNVSVFSRSATPLELLLFDGLNAATPIGSESSQGLSRGLRPLDTGLIEQARAPEPARLERRLALPRRDDSEPGRAIPAALHVQRLLGTAEVRGPACCGRNRRGVATLHGYGADLPDDLLPRDAAPAVSQGTYVVQPRSIVVLALALPGATGSALGTG